MSLLFSTFIHYWSPSWWRDVNLSHQNWSGETKNILLKTKKNPRKVRQLPIDKYGQIFSRSLSWEDAKPRPMGRQTRHQNILDQRRSMDWTWDCFDVLISLNISGLDEDFSHRSQVSKICFARRQFCINVKLLVSVLGYCRPILKLLTLD